MEVRRGLILFYREGMVLRLTERKPKITKRRGGEEIDEEMLKKGGIITKEEGENLGRGEGHLQIPSFIKTRNSDCLA